jgi:hypothetical protein
VPEKQELKEISILTNHEKTNCILRVPVINI